VRADASARSGSQRAEKCLEQIDAAAFFLSLFMLWRGAAEMQLALRWMRKYHLAPPARAKAIASGIISFSERASAGTRRSIPDAR